MRWRCVLGAAFTAVVLVSAAAAAGPTKAQVVARTTAAVKASRARLVSLKVAVPHASYALVVRVADPAAYLKHRVNTVVDAMNRLTDVPQARFTHVRFRVENGSGRSVFSYSFSLNGDGSSSSSWRIAPKYVDCARTIDLDIEIDPERVAPPCPAV